MNSKSAEHSDNWPEPGRLTDASHAASGERYDVVIVGGGHNGLVAANYLAAAGLSVLILERGAELGGATQSVRLFPDFDARLSRYSYLVSLFPPQIARDLKIDFRTKPRRIASYTAWADAGGRPRGFAISNDSPESNAATIAELGGGDAEWQGYQQFGEHCRAIANVMWPTLLQPLLTRDQMRHRLSSAVERAAWEWFVERPLGEAIEHFVQHDALRGLLMTDGKIGVHTHPHDRSLLQNRCFLYHVVGGGDGNWAVPVGGMQALVNALSEVAVRRGVRWLTRATGEQIVPEGNEYSVHYRYEDRQLACNARFVLVNAAPSVFQQLTGQSRQPSVDDEGSVVKVNMLLARLPRLKAGGVSPPDAFTGSFHVNESYQQMIASYRQADAGELPAKPPFEMYCHTLTDDTILSPELRAAGYQTLTLFGLDMPYRLFQQNNDVKRQQVLERYLQALDELCEEPFLDCLACDASGRGCLEIKTPLDLEAELGLDQGNIFHNAPSWFFRDQISENGSQVDVAADRWGVETNCPGIFLAGSSAQRGGAVSGIPGHNAARRIFDELGIG
ncbi:phytoene desaturase family protein [Planctomycetaceae bacterium SH139]